MDVSALRESVRRTAEDFEWLEAHCRGRADLARAAGELRLAASLTRNVIGPAVEGAKPPPLFIAVVGGAGAGKSTVVNFLAGAVVAEANPQAGYTRHPIAFKTASMPWPAHLGFIGPLRRLDTDASSSLDEDVYQVRPLPPGNHPLADFVLWDCPDMTTWASTGYVSRLMEVSALADVIVYVASDERYNDEVPTQFLQLLVRGGKAVVVVLTKMRPENAVALAEHFRSDVLEKITEPDQKAAIPIVSLPELTISERNEPIQAGSQWRIPLLNQVLVLCPGSGSARDRTVQNAIKYLEAAAGSLLDVARTDLAELTAWSAAVQSGQHAFATRYRNEYLAGEPFQRFERTRDDLLGLLEFPGQARTVNAVLHTLRWPFDWVFQHIHSYLARNQAPNLPEKAVLTSALTAWLDGLQAESLRRAGSHTLWKTTAQAFDSGLKTEAQQTFNDALRTFEEQERGDLDAAARALPENLSRQSNQLLMLRVAAATAQFAVILLSIWCVWHYDHSLWNLIWVIPLAAFLGHKLVALFVRLVVERDRRRARDRREQLLAATVTGPLAAWFQARPISGGSPIERLQQILQRVPVAIRSFAASLAGRHQ